MELWAFGTSPHGLGLAKDDLFALTLREHAALRKVAEERSFSLAMFNQLRADLHNAHMPRKDGRAWTAEDFSNDQTRKPKHPRNTLTPEQLQLRIKSAYPKGRSRYRRGKVLEMPAVEALKGTGQPLPNKAG